uniref:SAGA-associated factor 11 n=1 Tax=Tanacetum cinerariifolium TaxID=118510 RepID=A0A6L2MG39_TANCI|nr:hypothetical protein [Tanacetum cinerariifolium]
MTTIMEGRSTSQIMADDVGRWKLAAQYIQRELKEADEVNLLDEEDMHVFGLRPMMDPLILVCCNSCKKPVKVSQYATHEEICKSLSLLVDSTKENDVVAVKKKPPKKEKKKIQISISPQAASVGKPERPALANTAASNSHVDEQTLKMTSFRIQTKGREFPKESQARSMKKVNSVTSHQIPRNLDDHHIQSEGMPSVPAPLATKIYYSQRTQRLRSAISHMYHRSSYTQHDNGLINMEISDCYRHNNIDDQRDKVGNYVPYILENNLEPFPAKSPEVISDESVTVPPTSFPYQYHVNNVLAPQEISNPFDEN